MTPALAVANLRSGYGKIPVVHNISFELQRGEIVGLLGRNGAGKTTTLLAIAGFLAASTGTIEVDGQELKGSSSQRTRTKLGLVLEGRSVFPSLTVRRNLRLARADIDEAIGLFPELEPRIDVRAGMLSGGEQQMLSLARAVCRHPPVLLIDEVSFGLAPLLCERIYAKLRDVAHAGTAILLVEQHLHFAAETVDRALIMNEGRIQLSMTGRELITRAEEVERIYLGGVELEPGTRVL